MSSTIIRNYGVQCLMNPVIRSPFYDRNDGFAKRFCNQQQGLASDGKHRRAFPNLTSPGTTLRTPGMRNMAELQSSKLVRRTPATPCSIFLPMSICLDREGCHSWETDSHAFSEDVHHHHFNILRHNTSTSDYLGSSFTLVRSIIRVSALCRQAQSSLLCTYMSRYNIRTGKTFRTHIRSVHASQVS